MSKLLILGNTNVYTFCNSILGANEKSKEIFDGESISEIYVIHSPESFNELFVKIMMKKMEIHENGLMK